MCSFRKCQEVVRRETTKGCSIESIRSQTVRSTTKCLPYLNYLIHKASINQIVSGFFDSLIRCLDIHI